MKVRFIKPTILHTSVGRDIHIDANVILTIKNMQNTSSSTFQFTLDDDSTVLVEQEYFELLGQQPEYVPGSRICCNNQNNY